jgi:hypothetical protein
MTCYRNKKARMTRVSVILLMLAATPLLLTKTSASPVSSDEEVVLSFSHPAVGQYYINALFSDNTVYLPAMEIFNLLYMHYEKGTTGQSLQGTWLNPDNRWIINADTYKASSGKESFPLKSEDFRLGDLDLYLSPALFERIFGLRFIINMSSLSLDLESDNPLPVEEKNKHELLRMQLENKSQSEPDFPLLYKRNRKIAGAGMVDYYVSLNADNNQFSADYTVTGGMELLGGDLQGTVYGSAGSSSYPIRTGSLNWRFALPDNTLLTSVRLGEISTTGLSGQHILGGAISNDPIEPRKVYSTYSMDGSTIPDSEVELYVNNQLTDFTHADELGYYRFSFSLTYGTVSINIRIYTPTGEIITEERQLQIPFTFLPRGTASYNVQGGVLDDGLAGIYGNRYSMHGDLAYGLTNTITIKAGTDYFSYNLRPLSYGSFSTRLFDKFLLNLDAAPGAFYRATANVNFPSGRSYNLVYTKFDSDSLYNPHHANQMAEASMYLPFRLMGLYSGLRLQGEHFLMMKSSLTAYNIDFNTRVGQFNFRTNYRDRISVNGSKTSFGSGQLTGAVTYTFSHTPGVPVFVKGMFMRGQVQYDLRNRQVSIAGLQVSKSVCRKGRININADHDMRSGATFVQAGLMLDLNKIRLVTQYQGTGNNYSVQQVFNGSAGLDSKNAKVDFSNREQVGRAAVSVLMFIDSNENGRYDKGEEKVPVKGFRLSESATFNTGNDSILRITQLQSYWKYNAEIVQSALPDPTLAPAVSEFSFITDPNRFKLLEIPLYRTGVIEGRITISNRGNEEGLGGIRLVLKGLDHKYEENIRTFSDGGYYVMKLLPGKYTLEVDPAQISFLNAISQPGKLDFEIKALSEGDYQENLNFFLIRDKSAPDSSHTKEEIVTELHTDDSIAKIPENPEKDGEFTIQLGAFRLKQNAENMKTRVSEITDNEVELIKTADLFKIKIKGLKTTEEVEKITSILITNGISSFYIIRENLNQHNQ